MWLESFPVSHNSPGRCGINPTIRLLLSTGGMCHVLVVGIVLLLIPIVGASWFRSRSDAWVVNAIGLLGALIIFTPFRKARQLTHQLRTGVRSTAVVGSVLYYPKGTNRTFDSMENGMAVGKFSINGQEPTDFQLDQPWALDVRVGTRIDLLVSGPRQFDRLVLGLASDSPPVLDSILGKENTPTLLVRLRESLLVIVYTLSTLGVSFGLGMLAISTVRGGVPIERTIRITVSCAIVGFAFWLFGARDRPNPKFMAYQGLTLWGLVVSMCIFKMNQHHLSETNWREAIMFLVGVAAIPVGAWASRRLSMSIEDQDEPVN